MVRWVEWLGGMDGLIIRCRWSDGLIGWRGRCVEKQAQIVRWFEWLVWGCINNQVQKVRWFEWLGGGDV